MRFAPNLAVWVILGHVPGYQTWFLGSYSGMYTGTKLGCWSHARIHTQVPNVTVWVILGHVRGVPPLAVYVILEVCVRVSILVVRFIFGYSGMYPVTKPGCGHTRVCTRVLSLVVYVGHGRVCTCTSLEKIPH